MGFSSHFTDWTSGGAEVPSGAWLSIPSDASQATFGRVTPLADEARAVSEVTFESVGREREFRLGPWSRQKANVGRTDERVPGRERGDFPTVPTEAPDDTGFEGRGRIRARSFRDGVFA